MARTARVKSNTGKYAILLKGIDEDVFKAAEKKDAFRGVAEEYLGNALLGIRFFSDRTVMIVKESENGISRDMKPVLIKFARAYNRDKNTEGKVFADRFKSVPIENSEFEKQCTAYINGEDSENPFKAKTAAVKRKTVSEKSECNTANEKPKPKKKNDMPTWLL